MVNDRFGITSGANNKNGDGGTNSGFHSMSVREIRRRSSLSQMDVPTFGKKEQKPANDDDDDAAAASPKEKECTLDDTLSTDSMLNQLADLFGKNPCSKISRSDLYRMILDRVSVKTDVEVMEAIFEECDTEETGLVSIEELHNFLREEDEFSTRLERTKAILVEVLSSLTFWCFLFFATAELTSFCYTLRWKLTGTEEADWNYASFYNYLLIIGSYGFVSEIHDEYASELRLVEKAKAKVLFFVKENALSMDSTVRDSQMNPKAFSAMLERGGLYLPSETLMHIFEEIDNDENGEITFDEFMDYAEDYEKRGKLRNIQFQLMVLKTCFLSWDYWLEWGWLVAAVMNLITSYASGYWSDDTIWIVDGTAYCLYLFCALWQHRENYKYAEKTVQQGQDMKKNLETLVVQVGAQVLAHDGDGSEENLAEQIDSSLRQNDEQAKSYCRIVFGHLDTRGGVHDGSLDFIELYDALTQAGFVIELEVLRSIFDDADKDGNGQLEIDEFVNYIMDISITKTRLEKLWVTIKTMVSEKEDFWAANFELIGAVLLVTSNFGTFKSFKTEVNLWLASDFFWFVPAFYLSFSVIPVKAGMYDALAHGKSMFRKAINQALLGGEERAVAEA